MSGRLERRGIGISVEAVHARRRIQRRILRNQVERGDKIPFGLNTQENVQAFLERLTPEAREKAEKLLREQK